MALTEKVKSVKDYIERADLSPEELGTPVRSVDADGDEPGDHQGPGGQRWMRHRA